MLENVIASFVEEIKKVSAEPMRNIVEDTEKINELYEHRDNELTILKGIYDEITSLTKSFENEKYEIESLLDEYGVFDEDEDEYEDEEDYFEDDDELLEDDDEDEDESEDDEDDEDESESEWEIAEI